MERKGFLHGAAVLLLANAIVKAAGAIFKIPLANLIGDGGMGLFSVAYSFYAMLFVLSTAGLPVAVSGMVSHADAQGRDARATVRRALVVFAILGATVSVAVLLFAEPIACALGEKDAKLCMMAIAPAIFFVTVTAVLRGWHQGKGTMEPTGASQIIEAACKVLIGLGAAILMMPMGIQWAAAGAILGMTVGTAVSMIYLLCRSAHDLSGPVRDKPQLGKLMELVIPVTLSASILSVVSFVEVAVILHRLPLAGFTAEQTNRMFGAYSGMAQTLFNLPQTLASALAMSLIPEVAAAHAQGSQMRQTHLTHSVLRLTMMICIPCGAGLSTLAGPILRLLYPAQPRAVMTAEPLLFVLGFAVPLVGLATVTTAVLQASGREAVPVVSMTAGGIVKLAMGYFLLPQYGIEVIPFTTIAGYGVIAVWNLIVLARQQPVRLFSAAAGPLTASVGMASAAYLIYDALNSYIQPGTATMAAICGAAGIYAILLVLLGVIRYDDIIRLPGGGKIAAVMGMKS